MYANFSCYTVYYCTQKWPYRDPTLSNCTIQAGAKRCDAMMGKKKHRTYIVVTSQTSSIIHCMNNYGLHLSTAPPVLSEYSRSPRSAIYQCPCQLWASPRSISFLIFRRLWVVYFLHAFLGQITDRSWYFNDRIFSYFDHIMHESVGSNIYQSETTSCIILI